MITLRRVLLLLLPPPLVILVIHSLLTYRLSLVGHGLSAYP